ncbi:MAG: hypothetical protein A3G33_02860 [Omnitrophica bacterium RIFCSPLOWO2_12_FULL_44_17]|uniref:SHS2 domain-containing protein n=1 Tax=Candidatus Danuiimicrobium aquiferis TaxID=1801832 RepID=A0A1G1KWH3_9BACT|nr:MAG: hypothetical protein A3B72_04340 [Omnitrophica bacterium RIFCSPHIGHO2_02_FULL_45_28]OGW96919.1 MAG: hypothetical protein A3G33_02860 [Omnitrophica bacterium RIFCSPLOWO2_12_FULL_44_17]
METLETTISTQQKFGTIPQKSKSLMDLVGIDLSGNIVKIVHAKVQGGRIVAENVVHNKFAENADDEISQFIVKTLKKFRVRTKKAICVIPSKLLITKNVDMPSRDRNEIDKIVDLQAGRFTPYSRTEIVIDYLCMDTPEQYYTNVFLIIMHRKMVERYLKIFEKAQLDLDKVAVSSEGMGIAYHHIADTKLADTPVGGIHFSNDCSDLTIIDRQQLVFIRNIPIGLDHLKENKEWALGEFLKQLNKSMLTYQNQGVGRPIAVLVVTGLVEELDYIEKEIRESVPYVFASKIPIKMVPYQTYFSFRDGTTEGARGDGKMSFFEILSCLFSYPRLQIDLIPKEIKLKRKFQESGHDVIMIAILLFVNMFLICGFLAGKMVIKSNYLENLTQLYKKTVEESNSIRQMADRTKFLRSILESRGKGLGAFQRVTGMIGQEIYLSEFRYGNDRKIVIVGTADSMSRVFNFVTELEQSGYFESVKTNQTKSRREAGKDVADFEIETVIRENI